MRFAAMEAATGYDVTRPVAHHRRRPSLSRATGRWRFLADASAALDASIDYDETLASTVRLAVPEVSDYCIVVLLNPDGSGRWAHSAHRDAEAAARLERLRGDFPLPASSGHPLARALRTGQAQLTANARGDDWREDGRLGAIRAAAPLSSIAMPMIARGRTFGAILFAVTAESGRRYGARDLALAAEVGRRAGSAIDHALLYQASEQAARSRDQLMAVVAHDLKSPLSTIQLALRVFLDEDGERGAEGDRMERLALGAMERAAARMQRLIHDLLDLSRADGGKPTRGRYTRPPWSGTPWTLTRPWPPRSGSPSKAKLPPRCPRCPSIAAASIRCSRTSSEMRSSSRRRVGMYASRPLAGPTRCRSSSRTTGRAYPRTTFPTSSTDSGRRARRPVEARGSG